MFDRVKSCRLFPSTLDPMFALGNNAALQLLKGELDAYNYSSNLAALRYLIDSYDSEFWNGSIYNTWLNAVRKLNPPEEKNYLPLFMQTAAFWQEKLNTQLSSWSQLRHDNLLYAKQSYTGGTICSYPYTYIEPFPEFYKTLKEYAESAIEKFQSLPFNDEYLRNEIISYLGNMIPIMDTLSTLSDKILNKISFTQNEIEFLKTVIYDSPYGGSGSVPYKGWYAKLFYRDSEYANKGLTDSDNIVADIHTTPTDCFGTYKGWVTHVGTGSINMGVFIADIPGNNNIAFVGPVLSFYEYVTTNFLRLTDEEWADEYLASALRPSWVNLYLADITGNSRGTGLQLLTSVDGKKNPNGMPLTHLVAANYPNPFNPSTIISFTIPYDLSNSDVELVIYNIQGEVIARLVNENLPAGNYLTKWDGKNEKGISVTSGVYIYNLKAGDRYFSGKMMLLK